MCSEIPYRKRPHQTTPLVAALSKLKATMTWQQLSEWAGVPVSTLRHWTYVPPRKLGRSVGQVTDRLVSAGMLET